MCRPNLQSVALPIPEIIAISVLGWGCESPILTNMTNMKCLFV